MNDELKQIKKYYGEKFSHLCRELFPSILEKENNELLNILLEHFEPYKYLYEDIVNNNLQLSFSSYIYSFIEKEESQKIVLNKTPKELLKEVGYTLYECNSKEDIQKFKKYYASKETLCTFKGNRLNIDFVFFAVKDNVDEIKRENFSNPERQDEYGTSVISIQFTKDASHTLSIKNRYNHTVENPDATFSNNLDNIVLGLTESFEKEYGLIQQHKASGFEIPGYVLASDGKYYKYNYEIDNIYYCPNNIIIDNFKVKRYDKEKYIIMDYFILDLRKAKNYDKNWVFLCQPYCWLEGFVSTIGNIKKVSITKDGENKKIIMEPLNENNENFENIIIELDKDNRIIGYINNNVERIDSCFLLYNKSLEYIELSKVTDIGDSFLNNNASLKKIALPSIINIGKEFLPYNQELKTINLNVKNIGDKFMKHSKLVQASFPFAENIGHGFLQLNETLEYIDISSAKFIGDNCMSSNKLIKQIFLPSAVSIGTEFMSANEILEYIDVSNATHIGSCFLYTNKKLEFLDVSNATEIGGKFLFYNNTLKYLDISNLEEMPNCFLRNNTSLEILIAPRLEEYGKDCMEYHFNFLNQIIDENNKKEKQYTKKMLVTR